MKAKSTVRPVYRRLLLGAFLASMLVPLLQCNYKPIVSVAQAQETDWFHPGMDWFERIHVGFNHEFGGRQALIKLEAQMKLRVFGESPTDQVLIGRDGWLYLGRYYDYDGVLDYLRVHPFTQEEEDNWVANFQAKQQALASRGIPYVLLIAPTKQTVYPEHLPAGLDPKAVPSRREALVQLLRSRTTIDVVDVTDDLIAHKPVERVYYRTDTHWNTAGSLVAYRILLHHLQARFPQLAELPIKRLPNMVHPATNLPRIDNMTDVFIEDNDNPDYEVEGSPHQETRAWTRDNEPDARHPVPTAFVPLSMVVSEGAPAQMQRALFIGDSYLGYGLGAMLAQHFEHSERVFWHRLDLQQVDREKPQLVVEEILEQHLDLASAPPLLP